MPDSKQGRPKPKRHTKTSGLDNDKPLDYQRKRNLPADRTGELP